MSDFEMGVPPVCPGILHNIVKQEEGEHMPDKLVYVEGRGRGADPGLQFRVKPFSLKLFGVKTFPAEAG